MNNDSKFIESLKKLRIVHIALTIGQIAFAVIVFNLKFSEALFVDISNTNNPFLLIVPMITIVGFTMGNFLFKKQLATIKREDSDSTKISKYQTATILKFALLEGPSLLGIVAFMLSGNLIFLIFSGIIILYFISLRPSDSKVEKDLNITSAYDTTYQK